MALVVAGIREASLAEMAAPRLLAGVGADMLPEVAGICESAAANGAGEGLLASVGAHVSRQTTHHGE